MTAAAFIAATLTAVAVARFAPAPIARAVLAWLERADAAVCEFAVVTDDEGVAE